MIEDMGAVTNWWWRCGWCDGAPGDEAFVYLKHGPYLSQYQCGKDYDDHAASPGCLRHTPPEDR
jgi:hypothetical protein